MKEYKTSDVRNVAILGHMSSGKTSIGESLLYVTKAIEKKGEVERKNTVGDYTPEEQNRLTTLTSSLLPVEWNNKKINFIDTPGSEEFIGEVENVLSAVEGALLLIDATKGVEVGTERTWIELRKRNIPTIIVINKMDKENIKYGEVLNSIKQKLSAHAVEFTMPIGAESNFNSVVDIVNKKVYVEENCSDQEIPNNLKAKVDEIYEQLLEVVAESSEELLDKFFSGEKLSEEEICKGLRNGLKNAELFPIVNTNSLKNIGICNLLNMITDYIPSPSEKVAKVGIDPRTNSGTSREMKEEALLSAYIFKTLIDPFLGTICFFKLYSGSIKAGQDVYVPDLDASVKLPPIFTLRGKLQLPLDVVNAGDIACVAKVNEFSNSITFTDKKDPIVYPKVEHPTPVFYMAISPKNKQDEDKLSSSINKLKLEDETIEIRRNPETAQLLIGGQGLTHIGYIIEKLRNMFKVDVEMTDPKVVYRETIRTKGEAQGRHKKQSGGAGQFGDVWIRFEPTKENFEFKEEVVGGSVPKNYFPAVEKGLIDTMEHGPLAGFPVIGVRAILYDGSYHPVDSNEISFKIAASLAFKNALDKIRPTILEPIMQVNVFVKNEFVGDIMGDMTKRRGRVLGMEQKDGIQEVIAEVPESEIIKYAIDLKAMTQAGGRFSRKFLRYEEVPEMLIKKIIDEYKK